MRTPYPVYWIRSYGGTGTLVPTRFLVRQSTRKIKKKISVPVYITEIPVSLLFCYLPRQVIFKSSFTIELKFLNCTRKIPVKIFWIYVCGRTPIFKSSFTIELKFLNCTRKIPVKIFWIYVCGRTPIFKIFYYQYRYWQPWLDLNPNTGKIGF